MSRARAARSSEWTRLDASAAPGAYVALLEGVESNPSYLRDKSRSLELLGLRGSETAVDLVCGICGRDAVSGVRVERCSRYEKR